MNPEACNSIDTANSVTCTQEPLPKIRSKNQEITIFKMINKGKFPVYLSKTISSDTICAMKVFPYEGPNVSKHFTNEARFVNLSHPNIISVMYDEKESDLIIGYRIQKISFTLMEYAPNRDLYDAVMDIKMKLDEMVIRTYFHQLIEGLNYLHSQGIAHLDLKLENLLLDENYKLKIVDFDLSYMKGDKKIRGQGTKYFRAPEIIEGSCANPEAADIYSAGIILFVLKAGALPHYENEDLGRISLYQLLQNNPDYFWKCHCMIHGYSFTFWDVDFKDLFCCMTKANPLERPSIEQIKKSKWYDAPIYSDDKLSEIMEQFYQKHQFC
jgi:serine/threonine protein kinase